jgi:hypothetical protein
LYLGDQAKKLKRNLTKFTTVERNYERVMPLAVGSVYKMAGPSRYDSAIQHNPMPAQNAKKNGPVSFGVVLRFGQPTKSKLCADYSLLNPPIDDNLFLGNGLAYQPDAVSVELQEKLTTLFHEDPGRKMRSVALCSIQSTILP